MPSEKPPEWRLRAAVFGLLDVMSDHATNDRTHDPMHYPLTLSVNQQTVTQAVQADLSLLALLRQTLGLTGTHQGCDTAQCGACTVLVDGQAIKSCNVLALQMQSRQITTIEGLHQSPASTDHPHLDTLHVMQQAFIEHGALQCGFCTPGMIMRAVAMATERVPIDEHAIAHALGGNLCRCTGYQKIVQAVMQGLRILRAQD